MGRNSFHILYCVFCIAAFHGSASGDALRSQQGTGLEFDRRIDGRQVMGAVEPLRDVLQKASVAFFRDGGLLCYGIIMDDDSILTKASMIPSREGVQIRFDDRVFMAEEWSDVDKEHDLVLVRVKNSLGAPCSFSEAIPQAGTIVVSNGATTRTKRRARIGVISTAEHEAPYPGDEEAYVGVSFDEPAFIGDVKKGSPAEKSGLKKGDLVLSIDGHAVSDFEDMGACLDGMKPGAPSLWSVEREGRSISIRIIPGNRHEYLGEKGDDEEMKNSSSSKRKYGFPRVIQHDASLLPSFMGGPLLDLKGRVVGINIARVNRAETYAIPAKDLLEAYRRLKSW